MTEQRVNGDGAVVEYDEDTDKWVPVKDDKNDEPVAEEAPVETPVNGAPAVEAEEEKKGWR